MARKEFHGRLARFFESSQRTGCCYELAQVKQRFTVLSFAFRITFLVDLVFALQRRGDMPRVKNECLHG
jgi:hypothetical protein